MKERWRERVLSAAGTVLGLVWFLASMLIATSLGVEANRGNLWVVCLIFLAPLAVFVVIEELMHRIKHGPQQPGRHSREP